MWSGHGHRHLVVGEDEPAKPAAANAVQKLFTSAARRPRLAGWLDASDNAQVPYLVAIRTRRFALAASREGTPVAAQGEEM